MVDEIMKRKSDEVDHHKYPSDWKIQCLGKNSTLKARIGWQGLTTAEYLERGEYFLITGTDFNSGKIDWKNCHYVDKKRFDQDRNIQIKNDDILVTKDGTIGKVAFIESLNKEATLNSGVFVIRPIKGAYNPRYLYHVLMSDVFKDFLDKLAAGSTISHLYQKDFVNFRFPVPPVPEQQAIAEVLSNIDDLIICLEKLIDKKKKVKQGAMQELLTGKRRLSGFSGEWKTKKIVELVEFLNGKAHENSIAEAGTYIVANSKFVSTEGKVIKYSNQQLCPAINKDILMVMSDVPNGRAIAKCYYVDEDNRITVNQRICILRCKSIVAKFLFYTINRHPYYLSFDDGVKQTNLRKEDVLNCELLLPPTLEEQQEIAQILTDMDDEITTLEQKLNKYKVIKQGMMQELLAGRIRLI